MANFNYWIFQYCLPADFGSYPPLPEKPIRHSLIQNFLYFYVATKIYYPPLLYNADFYNLPHLKINWQLWKTLKIQSTSINSMPKTVAYADYLIFSFIQRYSQNLPNMLNNVFLVSSNERSEWVSERSEPVHD